MTDLVNLTPHTIVFRIGDRQIEVAPSGLIARVEDQKPRLECATTQGIPCVSFGRGAVVGIPEPVYNTLYIVSGLVFDSTDRQDVVAPDTGKTAVRNINGQIEAVTQLRVKFVNLW